MYPNEVAISISCCNLHSPFITPSHAAVPTNVSMSRLGGRVSAMPPASPNGAVPQSRVAGGNIKVGRQSSMGGRQQQLPTGLGGRRSGQVETQRTKTRAGKLGQILPMNDRLMAIPSAAGSVAEMSESPYPGSWVCLPSISLKPTTRVRGCGSHHPSRPSAPACERSVVASD